MNQNEPPADRQSGAIIGKTDYDLSPAYLADQFRLDDEHVLSGQRIVNRIEQVGHPDGRTVWNVTNKIPILDAQGAIIGTAGITRPLDGPREADGLVRVRSHPHVHAGSLR